MAQKKFYDELERLKQRLAARETYRTAVPAASAPAALEPYLREPYGPRPGLPATLAPALTYPTNNMVRPDDRAELAARETYRTMIPPPAPPPPLETYLTQPYGPPAVAPAALGGTAWDAIKAQMKAPKAEAPPRPSSQPDFYQLPRRPVASQPDFYQLPRRPVASQPDFYQLPRTPVASQPDFYQLPRRPATTSSKVAVAPSKAQQKIIDDAAKNYQSNSMPVLMQPQGPMKGGATMQPSINWGDANDAADFFRADALRRQMPGLLGWGGE